MSLDLLPPLAPPLLLDLNAEPVPSPKRPKARDICWQHVTETGSKATRNYRWTCNYCPITSALPSVERVYMYGHFLHVPEVRHPQISGPCPGIPSAKKQLLLERYREKTRSQRADEIISTVQCHLERAEAGDSSAKQVVWDSLVSGTLPKVQEQPKHFDSVHIEQRRTTDQAIARAFYNCNIPAFIRDSKYWKEMITQVQKYGEGYGYGPDRHLLYSMMDNSLLCKEYECVKNRAQTRTRPILEQYMGSIASDGWKNCRRQSLLNVLLVTKNGAEYLKSFNTGGQPKTAEFIASFLRNVLNDPALMGKIIQVVMDNAANCKAAGVILKQEFTHFFFSGCAAHGLDLLLKDIKKLHWVDEALSLVPTVVNLIRGHEFWTKFSWSTVMAKTSSYSCIWAN